MLLHCTLPVPHAPPIKTAVRWSDSDLTQIAVSDCLWRSSHRSCFRFSRFVLFLLFCIYKNFFFAADCLSFFLSPLLNWLADFVVLWILQFLVVFVLYLSIEFCILWMTFRNWTFSTWMADAFWLNCLHRLWALVLVADVNNYWLQSVPPTKWSPANEAENG